MLAFVCLFVVLNERGGAIRFIAGRSGREEDHIHMAHI